MAWSIGNENPAGPDSQQVIDLVKKTDPTRPAFVSCVSPGDIKGQSWDDEHYPNPNQVDRVAANTKWGANFSEHPHIFYQKETQDYDPGASDLWTAADTDLWEEGLKFTVPVGLSRMTWQRDSYFTDYPAGHLGEPSGVCSAGDTLFRASERGLHWLTLTNTGGAGVALLAADTPLVGRAAVGVDGNQLLASREVAGPHDFSGSWVSDHDIHVVQGKPLGGSFTLRAVGHY